MISQITQQNKEEYSGCDNSDTDEPCHDRSIRVIPDDESHVILGLVLDTCVCINVCMNANVIEVNVISLIRCSENIIVYLVKHTTHRCEDNSGASFIITAIFMSSRSRQTKAETESRHNYWNHVAVSHHTQLA